MADSDGKAANPVVFFDVALGGKQVRVPVDDVNIHCSIFPYSIESMCYVARKVDSEVLSIALMLVLFQGNLWDVLRWSSSRM